MNFKKLIASLLLCISLSACGPSGPKISVSPERLQHKGWVMMWGEGFTPSSNIESHLRRPDGTEFPVLPMRTDDKGGFMHEIDTLLLAPGTHELWVLDNATNATSNVAKFEVTLAPPDPSNP